MWVKSAKNAVNMYVFAFPRPLRLVTVCVCALVIFEILTTLIQSTFLIWFDLIWFGFVFAFIVFFCLFSIFVGLYLLSQEVIHISKIAEITWKLGNTLMPLAAAFVPVSASVDVCVCVGVACI